MDSQQPPTAGTPIYQESQEKNAKWLWVLIILIIIGALVFAFVRKIGPFSKLGVSNQESPSPISFASSPPSSPEATSGSQLDKSQPKIRVLNGSGKTGMAASAKSFLESKGYKVVSIGNADNDNFANTVVRLKETFKQFEKVLIDDLSAKYLVKTGDLLQATDSADIEVTVGAK